MKEQSTETVTESGPVWEGLEAFARQGIDGLYVKGRAGEGQGRPARGPGRSAGRSQGDSGRQERPPRVDGELAHGSCATSSVVASGRPPRGLWQRLAD